ncbi:MAG: sugar ABC transporter ATP-binding protein [Hyphomicrobiales bacterium]|nr:sugar ABC transporter ATP-binding protein [Hyphomicrobiales bacterium]
MGETSDTSPPDPGAARVDRDGNGARGNGDPNILRVTDLSKSYGAVVALDNVSLSLPRGKVTGLVGDNGAGKSTLVRIVSGTEPPNHGEVEYDGRRVRFASPAEARNLGIETVYQDLALAENMPVWANVFIGREVFVGPPFLKILDRRRMIAESQEMLSRFKMNVPPIDRPVEGLSGGQRQLIAIARAAAWGSHLVIMDEPTAALGVAETRAVEETIRHIRSRGFSILIISHNLDQVFRVTDKICVLRRGRLIGERMTKDTRPDEIVGMITGAFDAEEPVN